MKIIEGIVATLSREEKELHKELIEECRIREKQIQEARESSLLGIEEITNHKIFDLIKWEEVERC